MSENAKTIAFVAIGMVAIMIGLLARPSSAELDEETLVNTVLTKKIKSAEEAKSLRIVRFDEETNQRREFEVAEQDGLWTIPSKDGYPADADDQMAAAATSLIDRKILQVASRSGQDHEQYGVIDPSSPKLEAGQQGVGTRVTMLDEKKEPLVDLIVGKAVKDSEGQRYVREAGRDAVYVIEIDRSKLSTNFEDWIEKDLLKLETWDLQQVDIKDYSAALMQVVTQEGLGLRIERNDRAEMVAAYDDSKGKWTPVKLASFVGEGETGEYVEFKLADDEELNDESLNALKTALGDLKIVDVVRKPAGLSADLKGGSVFVQNEEAFVDLLKKGFTVMQGEDGALKDIACSDGEVIVTMKNGAEYVLRFGNVTNVASGEKDDAAAPPDAAAAAKKAGGDVHRYMFVMARHNKDVVKQPELKPLPELPTKEEPKPADAAAPAAETAPAETPAADAAAATPPAEGEPATPPATPAADAAPADAAKAEESKNEAAPATETPPAAAEDAKKSETPAVEAPAEKDKELEKVMTERKRIEDENQRKTKEYQELLKKGDEQVKELNLRFGDWYFVIDDEMFKKLRLGRDNVVKKKEPPKTEGAAPAGATNPFPATDAPPAGLPAIPGADQQ